jgi:MHS family proline/betaine transporter-like MFS transporter
MKKIKINKTLWVSSIGNILEYYDLGLFGFVAPIVATLYFPNQEPFIALIFTLSTFSSGFLARPLGALFFGYLGDRYGRKRALTFSIFLMSIPTTLIGILPTYSQIGILAPLFLFLLRFLQGFSTGGEYNGAGIFCIEHNDKSKMGFYGSIVIAAALVGFLLASTSALIFTQNCFPPWSWRIPFLIGGLIGIIGFYIRAKVEESPLFLDLKKSNKTTKTPFKEIFLNNKFQAFATFVIGGCTGGISLNLIGLPIFLTKFINVPYNTATVSNLFGIIFYILFTVLYGKLSDKYNPLRIFKLNSILIVLLAYPCYMILAQGDIVSLLFAQLIIANFTGGLVGPSNALVYYLFPTRIRYSGISFNFSLGLAIFGGLSPLISTTIAHEFQKTEAAALYLVFLGFLAFVISLLIKRYINYYSTEYKSY